MGLHFSMKLHSQLLLWLSLAAVLVKGDIFDDAEEDDSVDAMKLVEGPGIPPYSEEHPRHYLETRWNWRKADYDKDGKLTVKDMQTYFYDQFYKDHGVLTCGNDTTDRARAEMDGQGIVDELDTNKDGYLDFVEYSAQYKPQEVEPDDEEGE